MEKVKRILYKFNYIRTIPVWFFVITSKNKRLIDMDLKAWSSVGRHRFKTRISALNYFLSDRKSFRSLLIHRLKYPSNKIIGYVNAFFTRILWKPTESLYIATKKIGGGLFIQHGFSTIIAAKEIGKNCWVNQQVTIGFKGKEAPLIADNVRIHCGAKVLGGISIGENSVVGAGAVVVKDVPSNVVVGGVPAKIIKQKESRQ